MNRNVTCSGARSPFTSPSCTGMNRNQTVARQTVAPTCSPSCTGMNRNNDKTMYSVLPNHIFSQKFQHITRNFPAACRGGMDEQSKRQRDAEHGLYGGKAVRPPKREPALGQAIGSTRLWPCEASHVT